MSSQCSLVEIASVMWLLRGSTRMRRAAALMTPDSWPRRYLYNYLLTHYLPTYSPYYHNCLPTYLQTLPNSPSTYLPLIHPVLSRSSTLSPTHSPRSHLPTFLPTHALTYLVISVAVCQSVSLFDCLVIWTETDWYMVCDYVLFGPLRSFSVLFNPLQSFSVFIPTQYISVFHKFYFLMILIYVFGYDNTVVSQGCCRSTGARPCCRKGAVDRRERSSAVMK